MQFPHMGAKIAIDALECSNFSYFLLAHFPSSLFSLPLNISLDLHILHLLDEFMKGTRGRAGEQTTSLEITVVTVVILVTVVTVVRIVRVMKKVKKIKEKNNFDKNLILSKISCDSFSWLTIFGDKKMTKEFYYRNKGVNFLCDNNFVTIKFWDKKVFFSDKLIDDTVFFLQEKKNLDKNVSKYVCHQMLTNNLSKLFLWLVICDTWQAI